MNKLKIVQLIIKAINHVTECQKILSFLKKEFSFFRKPIFLIWNMKLRRFGLIFYSSHQSKSKGVAILLYRFLTFTLYKSRVNVRMLASLLISKKECYLLLSGYLCSKHVVFALTPHLYTEPPLSYSSFLTVTSSSPYLLLGGNLYILICLLPTLLFQERKCKNPC